MSSKERAIFFLLDIPFEHQRSTPTRYSSSRAPRRRRRILCFTMPVPGRHQVPIIRASKSGQLPGVMCCVQQYIYTRIPVYASRTHSRSKDVYAAADVSATGLSSQKVVEEQPRTPSPIPDSWPMTSAHLVHAEHEGNLYSIEAKIGRVEQYDQP